MADEIAAATDLGSADDLVYAEAIEAVVREELGANVVIAPFAATKDLSGTGSHVWSNPIWAALTTGMAAVAEADDMTFEAVSTNQNSVTASEAGVMTGVTDKLKVGNALGDGVIIGVGEVLGRNAARYIETGLAGTWATMNSGTSVGSTGSVMLEVDIQTALYTLEAAEVWGPKVIFLHSKQAKDLRADMFNNAITTTSSGAAKLGHEASLDFNQFGPVSEMNGYWADFYGIPCFVTNSGGIVNSTADVGGAMLAANYAMGMAYHWLGRIELQRNASGRVLEIVMTSDVGFGELHDSAGVPIETDAP